MNKYNKELVFYIPLWLYYYNYNYYYSRGIYPINFELKEV